RYTRNPAPNPGSSNRQPSSEPPFRLLEIITADGTAFCMIIIQCGLVQQGADRPFLSVNAKHSLCRPPTEPRPSGTRARVGMIGIYALWSPVRSKPAREVNYATEQGLPSARCHSRGVTAVRFQLADRRG